MQRLQLITDLVPSLRCEVLEGLWDSILGSVLHCIWVEGGVSHRSPHHRISRQLRFGRPGDHKQPLGEAYAAALDSKFLPGSHPDCHRAAWLMNELLKDGFYGENEWRSGRRLL